MPDFTRQLLDWYTGSGRHDLPWKQDVTPYSVWISEVMLQQTQVSTVIPYYQRFIDRFPDVIDLAGADSDEVLHLWSGLGYYSRARNLHRSARVIKDNYGGEFPDSMEALVGLPGIGRSTAGAILALSMDRPEPILDGNVKRVLCRYHAIKGWPGERETEKKLWHLADRHTSRQRPADYTQAIMDLGALICVRKTPKCNDCPVQKGCRAFQQNLQNDLPAGKPGKQIPVRQTSFIIIENETGEILLQKRPPTGIWGGLWGFPECPVGSDIPGWVADNIGCQVDEISPERIMRHTFTHFRLDITPVKMKLVSQPDLVRDEENLYWFSPAGDNKLIGMAAPVKKLVTKYFIRDSD